MQRETQFFNGVKYYRYPEAKNLSDRMYFRRGGAYIHRKVWESHNGEIPKGMHVHHKDRNPANNAIENLELISARLHNPTHHSAITPARTAHLDRVRPLTKKWHASEEGRAWHSAHGKQTFNALEPVEKVCEQCSSSFMSKMARRTDRFCSGGCKAKWRYDSGIDNETRICGVCKEPFVCNKYSRIKRCSRECGQQSRYVVSRIRR